MFQIFVYDTTVYTSHVLYLDCVQFTSVHVSCPVRITVLYLYATHINKNPVKYLNYTYATSLQLSLHKFTAQTARILIIFCIASVTPCTIFRPDVYYASIHVLCSNTYITSHYTSVRHPMPRCLD